MSAPTNTSAATAIAIPGLPFSTSQRVDYAGTTYTVWYVYSGTNLALHIGVFGFGDLTVYKPTVTLWIGTPDNLTELLGGIGGQNIPIQAPLNSNQAIYLKIEPNSGNPSPANLTLSVEAAPVSDVPVGGLLVPDDTDGFPALSVGSSDGGALRFFPLAAGETGDLLSNGNLIVIGDNTTNLATLYTSQLQKIGTLPFNADSLVRLNPVSQTFYIGFEPSAPAHAEVTTITSAGVLGPTVWTLAATGLTCGAPAADDTKLYYSAGGISPAVKVWNLATDTAGSDLVAAISGYFIDDMLTVPDGTLLVMYRQAGQPVLVKHYAADGSTIRTVTLGTAGGGGCKLAYAVDPATFWAWTHSVAPTSGFSIFTNINISSGATVTTFQVPEFEDGAYQAAASSTPGARFGPSFSCPLLVLRQPIPANTTPPTFDTVDLPIRRLRRSPHLTTEQMRVFYHRFQLDLQPGIGTLTGQGVNPLVMLRYSDDGGFTWSNEIQMGAGAQGQYLTRVYALMLGSGRDRVWEVSTSDPNKWVWIAAYLESTTGTS